MSVMVLTEAKGGRPTGRPPHMRVCLRCGTAYDFRRSTSSLKLTYCGIFCEQGDLGFTIDSLFALERIDAVQAKE